MSSFLRYSHHLATFGSLILLIGAFGFQEILGLEPCQLCIWQRWPHAIIPLIFIAILLVPHAIWFLLGSLLMFTSSVLAGFHVGVEQKWWEGLASCSSTSESLSVETILDFSEDISVVMCDQVVWSFFNLSMAGWNAVFSILFTILWVLALKIFKTPKA